MISKFAVQLLISWAARLNCHTFCIIPLNHTIFQSPINPRGFNHFYSHFLNGCMHISNWNKQFHKCVKCSVWLLLITHHRAANILYIIDIKIPIQLIVWPLIHYIWPSLWNFGFPRYGYYIVIATSYGFGYCFKLISATLVNSIHVDDFIPVLFVTNLIVWLITWTRLQALVTVWVQLC